MTSDARRTGKSRTRVRVVEDGTQRARPDFLATEEPMEIRLATAGLSRTVAVTMRTPGADFELATGFLHGEGILDPAGGASQIHSLSHCTDAKVEPQERRNIVTVELKPDTEPDVRPLERHFVTSSACGVCGKASLDQLELRGYAAPPPGPTLDPEVVYALPERLRHAQGLFTSTGGLHAAGLFDTSGEVLAVREDVGRHNAVDKLIGWAMLRDALPLSERILMVSGRSSYEILQKALAAGIPVVAAVSAPSSLAVDVAARFGMTLIGFLRGRRFNVYCGEERVRVG